VLLLRRAVSLRPRPRRDAAVTIQADFSESPDDLPELIRRLESGADLVLADARRRPGLPRAERLARRLAPLAAKSFARVAGLEAGLGTLRAYRVATVARFLRGGGPLLRGDGWAADLELLALASAETRRVEVVPVVTPAPPRQREPRLRAVAAFMDFVRASRTLRVPPPSPPAAEDEPQRDRPPRRGRGRRGGRGGHGRSGRAAGPPPGSAAPTQETA
jgi:hypothetical protein